jgi:O-antigen/teichoic acid export membrane protein
LHKRLQNISPKTLVFADQAIVSGSSFITNILVARSLGVSNYGKFSVIILIQLFLLSLQQAVSSGVYQVMFGSLEEKLKSAYTNGLFHIQLFLYAALIALCCVGYFFFSSSVNGYETIFIPAIIGTLLFLLQDFLRKILLSKKEEWSALLIDAITNIVQIVLLVVCALTGKLTLSIACWIIALTFIPSVIAGIIWIKPGSVSFANMQLTFGIHKKQSHWMLMSALLQWFAGNFFVVAAGMWLGIAALGALRLAQYIFGLLNVLLQAIENYALPHASSLQKSTDQFNGFLKNVFKKTFLMIAPVLLILSLFAKQILQFSGGTSYVEYSYVIHGLALVYVLILTGLPIRIALRVRLLNQNYFIGYLLASAFSMLTAKWLIREWHLTGVLTGLFLTQLIVIVYWSAILTRKKILTWKLFTSY